MRSQSLKIGLSLAVMFGAGAYLLADTFAESDAINYFYPADEVIAKKGELTGQRIRMGGYIEKGSILHKKGTLQYRFRVRPMDEMMKFPEAKGETVTVAYDGIVPDTFKDDAQIIVTGKLDPGGTFAATELTAKCPSKYEAEEKNKGTY